MPAGTPKAASLGGGYRIAGRTSEQANLCICTVRVFLLSGDEPAGRFLSETSWLVNQPISNDEGQM